MPTTGTVFVFEGFGEEGHFVSLVHFAGNVAVTRRPTRPLNTVVEFSTRLTMPKKLGLTSQSGFRQRFRQHNLQGEDGTVGIPSPPHAGNTSTGHDGNTEHCDRRICDVLENLSFFGDYKHCCNILGDR
jgi:hypothetical protein